MGPHSHLLGHFVFEHLVQRWSVHILGFRVRTGFGSLPGGHLREEDSDHVIAVEHRVQ